MCLAPDPGHADCGRATLALNGLSARWIEALGGAILAEHPVDESFSGDGLIVASFDPADGRIAPPPISRSHPARSLFGPDPGRTGR